MLPVTLRRRPKLAKALSQPAVLTAGALFLPPLSFSPCTNAPCWVLLRTSVLTIPCAPKAFPRHPHAWLPFSSLGSWLKHLFLKDPPVLLLLPHTQRPMSSNGPTVTLHTLSLSRQLVYCLPPQVAGQVCKSGDHTSLFPAVSLVPKTGGIP